MEATSTLSLLHKPQEGNRTSLELKECRAGAWGCGSYLLRARLDLGEQPSKRPQGRALTQSKPGEGTKRTQGNCPRLHKASPCTQGCFFLRPHTRHCQILFLSPSDIQPTGTCARAHTYTHTHTHTHTHTRICFPRTGSWSLPRTEGGPCRRMSVSRQ